MTTHPPSPSPIAPAHDDGTFCFQLFEIVALNNWTVLLCELAEVARVRGDRDVATLMAVVVSSGLAEDSDLDIDELVAQESRGGTH